MRGGAEAGYVYATRSASASELESARKTITSSGSVALAAVGPSGFWPVVTTV